MSAAKTRLRNIGYILTVSRRTSVRTRLKSIFGGRGSVFVIATRLKIFRLTHSRASDKQSIKYHFDVSNDFYGLWLDPAMVYSCAYFEDGDEDLATAQQKKIDHILTKIQLQPGHTLLDIGCGWGALVLRAAQQFGARCVGITLETNTTGLTNA